MFALHASQKSSIVLPSLQTLPLQKKVIRVIRCDQIRWSAPWRYGALHQNIACSLLLSNVANCLQTILLWAAPAVLKEWSAQICWEDCLPGKMSWNTARQNAQTKACKHSCTTGWSQPCPFWQNPWCVNQLIVFWSFSTSANKQHCPDLRGHFWSLLGAFGPLSIKTTRLKEMQQLWTQTYLPTSIHWGLTAVSIGAPGGQFCNDCLLFSGRWHRSRASNGRQSTLGSRMHRFVSRCFVSLDLLYSALSCAVWFSLDLMAVQMDADVVRCKVC